MAGGFVNLNVNKSVEEENQTTIDEFDNFNKGLNDKGEDGKNLSETSNDTASTSSNSKGEEDTENEEISENEETTVLEENHGENNDAKDVKASELGQHFDKAEDVIKYMIHTFKVEEDDLIYANKISRVISLIELVYDKMTEEYAKGVDFESMDTKFLDERIKENERLLNEIRKGEQTTRGVDNGASKEAGGDEENQFGLSEGKIEARGEYIASVLNDRKSSVNNNLQIKEVIESDTLGSLIKGIIKFKFKNKNSKHVETISEHTSKARFYELLQSSDISDDEMKEIENALDLGLNYEELASLIGKSPEKIRSISSIIMKGKKKNE